MEPRTFSHFQIVSNINTSNVDNNNKQKKTQDSFLGNNRDTSRLSNSLGVTKVKFTVVKYNEAEFSKAQRHVFKAPDYKIMTQEAIEACNQLGINPESM